MTKHAPPPTPAPAPTCKHCGKKLGSSVELHRAAGPAGIMRVGLRPCACARAKGERQRAEMRRDWLGSAAGRLAIIGAGVTTLAGLVGFTEGVALGGLLILAALVCYLGSSFSARPGSRRGTTPTGRGVRLPPVAPLPETRRRSAAD